MRINFIFFLSLIYSTTIICQSKQNNQWILGTHQGVVIDFNNEEPTVTNIEKDLLMNATNASICDEDGNLLFYTNGCDIFNKNFEIMENGDSISNQGLLHGLFCNTTGSLQSQAAMIFPRPETKNEYIVVHNDLMSDDFEGKGFLYYSVVDINENDGLGHVTEKDNIIRQDSINFFGISATRHANNIDWWIVFPLSQSNCYVKLLLTKKGVEYQNTQCLGEVWTSRSPQGSTKFSPDGKAYARILYQNGLSVSSFDNATGGFLDPVHINFDPNEEIFFAGVVYSANSRYMYALLTDRIIQYDLQAEDLDLSAIEVARLSTPDSLQLTTRFYHGTLGPDGKIYVGGNFAFNYLHIIHNPNCPGQFCNVEQYAMELSGNGGFSENGMPNLAYFDIPNNELQCDVLDTTTESIYDDNDMYLFPNPAQNIVNIKSEFPIENARIEFYDLSGKAIYSNSIDGPTSSINTSTFPTGIFIYKIFMDNDILRLGKFIKIE